MYKTTSKRQKIFHFLSAIHKVPLKSILLIWGFRFMSSCPNCSSSSTIYSWPEMFSFWFFFSFLKYLAEKEVLSSYLNVITIERVLQVLQLLLNCSAIKEVTTILCSNSGIYFCLCLMLVPLLQDPILLIWGERFWYIYIYINKVMVYIKCYC